MKILQTNLGRGRTAHDIAYSTACREGIDIVIIGEPNIKISKTYNYIVDKKSTVAIFIKNKNVGIKGHDVGDGYVHLKFEDWSLFACYSSPNIKLEDFKHQIDVLIRQIKNTNLNVVVVGDFNSKSAIWGSPITDIRGEYLAECAAELDLVAMNCGKVPTFERGNSKSYIDITWASRKMAGKITNWKVLQEEVSTYHNHIYFELQVEGKTRRQNKGKRYLFDRVKFAESIQTHFSNRKGLRYNTFIREIHSINRNCTNNTSLEGRTMPYWWNQDIEFIRKRCTQLRRQYTRGNKRNERRELQDRLSAQYKTAKKELNKLIIAEKKKYWKKMLDDLEDDIWGSAYKGVVKQLGYLTPQYSLTHQQRAEIIRKLFPKIEDNFTRSDIKIDDPPLFTRQELIDAANKIKLGKAPGQDHLTAEAVKVMAEIIPETILNVFNDLLRKQIFPMEWKEAKIVLLWKGKQMDEASAFRPLCMLSMLGKLYERMIKERLVEEMDSKGGLSVNQFGYIKGRSTVHAIGAVTQRAKNSREKWVAVMTLDIKNAFNSAVWSKIISELKKREIPNYLINLIENYFCGRKIVISKEETMEMTAGVPQGSVLGPVLWNVLYDGVLRLNLMKSAITYAYADDLILMVEAQDSRELMFRMDESLESIAEWMTECRLEIAPGKSEAVILKGPRTRKDIYFNLMGNKIVPQKQMKYLGVILDDRLSFVPHVKYLIQKSEARMAALARIMPNVGGPGSAKRVMLYSVIQSTVLYASPVWSPILEIKKYRDLLERLQRRSLLRVASGYRTVSTRAIQVICGIPPIALLAEERTNLFNNRHGYLTSTKSKQRSDTLRKWQEMWSKHEKTAQWTKTLIPNLIPWVDCQHRCTNYWLTQFLTGHGHFRSFTKRIRRTSNDSCRNCGMEDKPDHPFFECSRNENERKTLIKKLRQNISTQNLISAMIENREKWQIINDYIKLILQRREHEEKVHQDDIITGNSNTD